MALPKDVQDAVKFANAECGKSSDFTFDMSGADWQTIHAHLLSLDDELADYKNTSLHAADDCVAKDAEIARLRDSNRRLHRRCQEAESALPSYRKLIALPPNGDGVRFVSGAMGRALLVSMCNKLQAHGDAADALLREVYDHGENMALHEKIDAHLSENTHDHS
jgi:hypothetical protein